MRINFWKNYPVPTGDDSNADKTSEPKENDENDEKGVFDYGGNWIPWSHILNLLKRGQK